MLVSRNPALRETSFRLSVAAFLLALTAFWGSVGTAHAGDLFTVARVPVDVTAASATQARDQALSQAQAQAWVRLVGRLTLATDRVVPPPLGRADLERLVQSFEVVSERTSAVRYLGEISVSFRPSAVRSLLTSAGIRYAEVRSKPLVALAIDANGAEPLLWQVETAWRSAWDALPTGDGLVPLIVPSGDIQDVADIGAREALSGDEASLRRIADRLGAGGVAVLRLQGGSATATIHRFLGSPETVTVSGAGPMTEVAQRLLGAIEQGWVASNLLEAGQESRLTATIALSALNDWTWVRARLAEVTIITRTRILEISRTTAMVEIGYRGDATRLQTALEQRDLTLSSPPPGGTGPWRLARRAGS